MSSFIVEDKTINIIVSWIDEHTYGNTILDGYVQQALKKVGISSFKNDKELEEFANCLLYLNKLAVDYRYDEKRIMPKMKFKRVEVSNIQVLKSMQCLRYQLDEGEVPKHKLFKFLSELIDVLKDDIIYRMTEYEKAVWG
jgi:predicted house-cleaning noncanonical NTP pyrophosphatase (MazG superfamily)